jgi:hypothetical protein
LFTPNGTAAFVNLVGAPILPGSIAWASSVINDWAASQREADGTSPGVDAAQAAQNPLARAHAEHHPVRGGLAGSQERTVANYIEEHIAD